MKENIINFLHIPVNITQNNQDLVSIGLLDINDLDSWIPYLEKQYKNNDPKFISA